MTSPMIAILIDLKNGQLKEGVKTKQQVDAGRSCGRNNDMFLYF
ncbi:hypothetical protein ACEQPO_30370 [Bacillus sp. SL00103]